MAKEYRGSQKHILDLLDRQADRLDTLNSLLKPFTIVIDDDDVFRPTGRDATKEFYLPQFCKEHCVGKFTFSPIIDWWVSSQWRPPTWDFISTCKVDGRFGLLIVEAKAHEDEFDWAGKPLSATASIGSKQNHRQIVHCVEEANSALSDICDGLFNLSVESHYQLTNRVAHLWKLATCRIPVVLLYLGLTGDTTIKKSYFQNDEHWQRAMAGYLQGVVPQSFLSQQHDIGDGGSMLMLSRSLEVLGKSRAKSKPRE